MRRLLGTKKPESKTPAPTLDDVSTNLESRGGVVDAKVAAMDRDLAGLKNQMAKLRKGTPAYNNVQQKAVRLLKQKHMYEKQRNHLYNQSFNVDQTKFAQENAKDSAAMVSAMKDASKSLAAQYKSINISEVEDLHDDMDELLEQADEINEIMGRAYGVPDELDEDQLLEELEGLEDDLELTDETPSYLAAATKTREEPIKAKPDLEVDEFGLPKVPMKTMKA